MRRGGLLVLALALLVSACGGSGGEGDPAAGAGELEVTDVASVDAFKERFNADRGVPRLVVLVAPT